MVFHGPFGYLERLDTIQPCLHAGHPTRYWGWRKVLEHLVGVQHGEWVLGEIRLLVHDPSFLQPFARVLGHIIWPSGQRIRN